MASAVQSKSRYQMDMCRGPLLRKIVLFSIPLICSGILQLLFHTADLIVLGRFASYQALAAVGVTSAITQLLTIVCLGVSIGANVLVARYIGAKERSQVSRSVHTAISFSLLSGMFLIFFGFFVSRPVLKLMNTPEDVLDMAVTYMRIYFAGMPAIMLYNFGSAVLRAAGDTRRPFYFLVIGGVVNVILNLFFVVVCKWNVGGVATATIISQLLSGLLVLRVLVTSRNACRVRFKQLMIHWNLLKSMLWIGVPAGLQSACFSFANLWVQTCLNKFGAEVLAGNTAASTWEAIGFLLSSALGQALVSFVSQNYGGKQYKRIRRSIKYCAVLCVLTTVVFSILLWLFKEEALGLFNKDPRVIAWGVVKYRIMLPLMFACGLQEIYISALRGLGYSVGPTIVMIFCICVLRFVWLFTVYQLNPTYLMLQLTYPFTWSASALATWIYMRMALRKVPLSDTQS